MPLGCYSSSHTGEHSMGWWSLDIPIQYADLCTTADREGEVNCATKGADTEYFYPTVRRKQKPDGGFQNPVLLLGQNSYVLPIQVRLQTSRLGSFTEWNHWKETQTNHRNFKQHFKIIILGWNPGPTDANGTFTIVFIGVRILSLMWRERSRRGDEIKRDRKKIHYGHFTREEGWVEEKRTRQMWGKCNDPVNAHQPDIYVNYKFSVLYKEK